ncbi:MAG: hypothetical protein ACJA1C_000929 [Crocinitomicaceae bacterium]|jgi:hypothetical protein
MPQSVQIREILRDFNSKYLKMIEIRISLGSGKIIENSNSPFMEVSDGVSTVSAFSILIAPNKKHYYGYFTVDAFTALSSTVSISFGIGLSDQAIIEGVDLNDKESLWSEHAGITHEIANDFWLSNL